MRLPLLSASLWAMAGLGCAAGQAPEQGAARAEPAIEAISRAFDTRRVVALGDLHEAREPWAFYTALVSDPRIRRKIGAVTFECGSARYQAVLDRYVSGSEVPRGELAKVWRENTFGGAMCESPVVMRFLEAVRQGNAGKPRDQQLRVLAIDPPIDWGDPAPEHLASREASMIRVLETEVYAKNQKALFLVGSAHVGRVGVTPPGAGSPDGRAAPAMQQKRGLDGSLLPLPGLDGPTVRTVGPRPPGGSSASPVPLGPPPGEGPAAPRRGLDGSMLPPPGAAPVMRSMPGAPAAPSAVPPAAPQASAAPGQGPAAPRRGLDGSMLPPPGATMVMRGMPGAPPPGTTTAPGDDGWVYAQADRPKATGPGGAGNAVVGLERAHPGSIYVITTYIGVGSDTARFESWARQQAAPFVAAVKGNWLGGLRTTSENLLRGPDGSSIRPQTPTFETSVDAILYVAPRAALTRERGRAPCEDPEALALMKRRAALRGVQPGSPFAVETVCAAKPGVSRFFED